MQSFPNGDIFSFRANENSTGKSGKTKKGASGQSPIDALWHAKAPLHQPVVAVFDVVRTADSQPFALLQPRPVLSSQRTGGYDALPGRMSAYVGLLDESLFAMSAGQYPLVAFDHPFNDRMAEEVERACRNAGEEGGWNVWDKRCLLGTKALAQPEDSGKLEGRKGVGLLDGAPLSPPVVPSAHGSQHTGQLRHPHRTIPGTGEVDNTTLIPPNTWPWAALHTSSALLPYIPYIGGGNGNSAFGIVVLWATALGLIGAAWMYKRFKGVRVRFNLEFPDNEETKKVAMLEVVTKPVEVPALDEVEQEELKDVSSEVDITATATAPIALPSPDSPPTVTDPIATAPSSVPGNNSSPEADGEESGGEGGEGENGEPEKRKGKKKRRGKKKRAGAIDSGEGEEKEKDTGKEEGEKEGEEKVEEQPAPSGLVFTSAPKPVQAQVQAPTSLIVSDTILGAFPHS